MSIKLTNTPPPLADFIALRANEGWGTLDESTARRALEGALINLTLYKGDTVAGFARIVGDGVLYFYIQDFVVAPPHRGKGYGQKLLAALLEEIKSCAAPGATIGLMAAQGKEAFYERQGFITRPNAIHGAGMIQVLSEHLI